MGWGPFGPHDPQSQVCPCRVPCCSPKAASRPQQGTRQEITFGHPHHPPAQDPCGEHGPGGQHRVRGPLPPNPVQTVSLPDLPPAAGAATDPSWHFNWSQVGHRSMLLPDLNSVQKVALGTCATTSVFARLATFGHSWSHAGHRSILTADLDSAQNFSTISCITTHIIDRCSFDPIKVEQNTPNQLF